MKFVGQINQNCFREREYVLEIYEFFLSHIDRFANVGVGVSSIKGEGGQWITHLPGRGQWLIKKVHGLSWRPPLHSGGALA